MIDVHLDEEEMKDLGGLLRKIVSVGKKKVQNFSDREMMKTTEIRVAEPPAVKAYFDHKFNRGPAINDILKNAHPYIKGEFLMNKNNFFNEGSRDMVLAKVIPSLNTLSIVDISKGGSLTRKDVSMGEEANSTYKPLSAVKSSVVTDCRGKVYILGGLDTETNKSSKEVVRFNPATKEFERLNPMAKGRHSHSSCVDGFNLYVFNGRDAAGNILSSFEGYDVLSGSWTTLPSNRVKSFRSLLVPFKMLE